MISVPFHEIETTRMRLRKQKESDLNEYHTKIASNSDLAKYMLWEATDDIELTRKHLTAWIAGYQSKNYYRYVLESKEDKRILGVIQLVRFDEENNCCEVAYLLAKEEQNKGYMTEAMRAIFEFAFFELNVDLIKADHYIQNQASGKVMKRAGMRFVHNQKDIYQMKAHLETLSCYEIKKQDFQAINTDSRRECDCK